MATILKLAGRKWFDIDTLTEFIDGHFRAEASKPCLVIRRNGKEVMCIEDGKQHVALMRWLDANSEDLTKLTNGGD